MYKTGGLGLRDIHGVEKVYEVYTSLRMDGVVDEILALRWLFCCSLILTDSRIERDFVVVAYSMYYC